MLAGAWSFTQFLPVTMRTTPVATILTVPSYTNANSFAVNTNNANFVTYSYNTTGLGSSLIFGGVVGVSAEL
jgi:hypothetical protein